MALLRPNQLPDASTPLNTVSDVLVLDQGTGGVTKVLIPTLTEAGIPIASQGEAEAGEINAKRMTPLRTKQAFDQFIDDADVVKFGEAQSLSPEQQEQARENIGALARNGEDWDGDAAENAAFQIAAGGFVPDRITVSFTGTPNQLVFSGGYQMTSGGVRMLLPNWMKDFAAPFAEGDGNGGMVTGDALPTSGTIYLFGIMKADGTTDYCAATTLFPALPDDFVYIKYLFPLVTTSANNIRNVIQIGSYFRITQSLQPTEKTVGTSQVIFSELAVPAGPGILAHLGGRVIFSSGNAFAYVHHPDEVLPGSPSYVNGPPIANVGGIGSNNSFLEEIFVPTDSSGRVGVIAANSGTTVTLISRGWHFLL